MSRRISDTSVEAEQVLREIERKMPFDRKLRQMGEFYRTARLLHAAGERARNPEITPEQIHHAWLVVALGEALASQIRERAVNPNDENLPALRHVVAIFLGLNIAYAVGGSWASSLLGKPRFTYDADLIAEPFPGKEEAFCSALGSDYYVSLPAVQQAVAQRSSFNIIYTPSGFKVDIFVQKARPFDQSLMQRRRKHVLGDPATGHPLEFVSAEDVILLKLEWYRLGEESSERQWTDVLGVFERQAGRLDQAYLDHWAQELKIEDLLARARQESGA